MEYRIRLEAFEGPLDLLLHLIDKNEIDIYNIPVAEITEQYLEFLADSEDVDLENLSDFLVMAATLVNIKSRMLFPRYDEPFEERDDKEDDPREELVQRLLVYRKYKELASHLEARYGGEEHRVYYREATGAGNEDAGVKLWASLSDLFRAFKAIWQKNTDREEPYLVPQADIDIKEKMEEIIHLLRRNSGQVVFQDIFIKAADRREALALFLALLELIRQRRLLAVQEETFGQITIIDANT